MQQDNAGAKFNTICLDLICLANNINLQQTNDLDD
jgi:hypothetical protein